VSETETREPVEPDMAQDELLFDSALDAPPEKVWRAITIPELRDRWLPARDLAEPEPVSQTPGEEVTYRLKDDAPPFLESTVVFQVRPEVAGHGSRLTILHRLTDLRIVSRTPPAANSNRRDVLMAA